MKFLITATVTGDVQFCLDSDNPNWISYITNGTFGCNSNESFESYGVF